MKKAGGAALHRNCNGKHAERRLIMEYFLAFVAFLGAVLLAGILWHCNFWTWSRHDGCFRKHHSGHAPPSVKTKFTRVKHRRPNRGWKQSV